jgi:hypothetical protein
MSALTTIVVALVLAILVATLMWGGAGLVIAFPLALVGGAIAFALAFAGKRRTSARTDKVEFTERDEQTLVSD